jgi:hypothetical protein
MNERGPKSSICYGEVLMKSALVVFAKGRMKF